jgi:hypothetical protein
MSGPLSWVFGILAAICLIPSLYYGTIQDLKEFRFSKAHFESLWVNSAFVLTILMYLFLVIEGSAVFAIELLVLSVIATLIFSFIGFRFSSGGDWRALIYVAWIAPFLLAYVLFATGVCAIVQALYWVLRTDITTPRMFRKIPFALSIFCGYGIALGYFALTNL